MGPRRLPIYQKRLFVIDLVSILKYYYYNTISSYSILKPPTFAGGNHFGGIYKHAPTASWRKRRAAS